MMDIAWEYEDAWGWAEMILRDRDGEKENKKEISEQIMAIVRGITL